MVPGCSQVDHVTIHSRPAGRSFLDTDRRDRRAEAIGECAVGFAYPAATHLRVERQRG
jgi:hypothetical protein